MKSSANKLPSLDDAIFLSGGVDFVTSTLPLLLSIQKILQDKDVGEIVAETLIDSVKRVDFNTILLSITFYSNQKPQFTKRGFKRVITKIPNLRKNSLKWDAIKEACGGTNGYMSGRFRATANLSTGRQMRVYGASENEATERLLALHRLSNSKITTLTCAEMKKVGYGSKDDILHKESVRVYPAFATIINTEKIKDEARREQTESSAKKGMKQSTTQGLFVRHKTRKIPLWVDTPPPWFINHVNEMFANRGTKSAKT